MFDQLSAEIVPSLTKGRQNNNNNYNNTTNNNKAKCIPGGTLRVLAGKNMLCTPVTLDSNAFAQKNIGHGVNFISKVDFANAMVVGNFLHL
jgi:hypothetical protein